MTLEPLGTNVLVEPAARKETTESGLALPSSTDLDRPQTAVVKAVGPGVITLRAGDEVVYRTYAPDRVRVGDREFTLLDVGDVLAKIR